MKKYLMMGAAAVALTAVSAGDASAFGKGAYLGLHAGFSHNTAKLETKTTGTANKIKLNAVDHTITPTYDNKGTGAFVGNVFVGFDKVFKESWLFDVRLFGSYDTANVKLGTFTSTVPATTEGKFSYRPQFGVGLGFYFGRMLNEKIAGYLGLAGEFNFAKLKFEAKVAGKSYSHTDNIQVFSLTPSLGIKGHINDKMSWLAEVGYKFGLNASGVHKDLNMKLKTKPNALQIKVGASYHF